MGEVVVSSEEDVEMLLEEEFEEKEISTGLIRWERFLHRMFIRVMLVEPDDSTRQIIAALLRKCGYKVAAISDGLKAWETLKRRPHSIDLILTEVELPLISGFGLLTMVMENEICKNIPVIMMSPHDSIGVVFKCMLRGAADFLVKPVRKNELKNLWQHVWRRQSSNGGIHGLQDGSPAQQKVEDTSENNAASNHSSAYVASGQKNKECSEKESDTQSSCTKPDMEPENGCMQNMQDLLLPKRRSSSLSIDKKMQKHGECLKLDRRLLLHESELEDKSIGFEYEDAPCSRVNNSTGLTVAEEQASARTVIQNEDVAQESHREDANIPSETEDGNYELVEPSREAIDLIGAFDNLPRVYKSIAQEVFCSDSKIHSYSNDATNKLSSTPLLELSLRRSHPSDHGNEWIDRRHTLNHSNASAFSRYNNRKVQPLFPTMVGFHTEPEECANNAHKHLPNQGSGNTVDTQWNGTPVSNNQESLTPLLIGRPVQVETAYPCPQREIIPAPTPVSSSGYGAAFPPIFYTQSRQPALWSPNSASQRVSALQVKSSHQSRPDVDKYGKGCHLHDATDSTNQTLREQLDQNLESVDNPICVSPAPGQIGTSNFCNGATSQLNSGGCGSVCNGSYGNVTSAAVTRTTAESGNDEGFFIHDGPRGMESHRSIQREAALNKFRLKRKDRCYEKKVRYQSRKRLAEQRPRVKGQFVRQVPADPSSSSL